MFAERAQVYIIGRREQTLKESASKHQGEIIPVVGDVTDPKSLKAAAEEVAKKEKHIDLLVANSGVSGPGFDGEKKTAKDIGEQIMSTDFEAATKLFQTNALGYFYTSGAFLELLGNSPNKPQIITVTSNAAFGRRVMAGMLYSMTKAAAIHFTKMLSTHLSESNVCVRSSKARLTLAAVSTLLRQVSTRVS